MLKISLILFVVTAAACYPQEKADDPTTTETWRFLDHEFDRTPLGDSIDQASMKVLKEAFVESKNKNVVASPLGVLILLSMYAAGAGGAVRDEIFKALGAANVKELDKSYSGLSEQFSTVDKNVLTLANKIYVDKKFKLDETFVTKLTQYRSEIQEVDFQNPSKVIDIINRWAEEKTQGHIKKAVADDAIDDSVVSVLTNVIFFQGKWNVPFNRSETQEKDFFIDKSNKVQKPMMHLEQSLFYHESSELGAKLLELPYLEKDFRMVIVLPDEVDGLSSVVEKVAQRGLLTDIFSLEPAGRDVILDLPKFDIETELDLKSLLPKVGVSKIFSEPTTGIVKGEVVKVDKAFQKAFVKIDEEGATAGAFTGLVAVATSSFSKPPSPILFKADHPFLFTILYKDKMLFTGTYAQ